MKICSCFRKADRIPCSCGRLKLRQQGAEVMPQPTPWKGYTAVTSADPEKDVLIFSGGNVYGFNARTEAEIMEECALKMGWKGKTVTENSSRTTEENMTCSAKIIADSGSRI